MTQSLAPRHWLLAAQPQPTPTKVRCGNNNGLQLTDLEGQQKTAYDDTFLHTNGARKYGTSFLGHEAPPEGCPLLGVFGNNCCDFSFDSLFLTEFTNRTEAASASR